MWVGGGVGGGAEQELKNRTREDPLVGKGKERNDFQCGVCLFVFLLRIAIL